MTLLCRAFLLAIGLADRIVHLEDQLLHRAALAVLRTRPPVGEEGEEVCRADGAVIVIVTGFADAPGSKQRVVGTLIGVAYTDIVKTESTVKLWSWQTTDVSPCKGDVDSTKGEYWQVVPTIRPAYRKLWKVLKTDQIVWACASRTEFHLRPDRQMDVWIIEAPRPAILKLVDGLRWDQYVWGKLDPEDTDFSDIFVEAIVDKHVSAILRHPLPSEWIISIRSYVGKGRSVLPPE